MAPNISSPGVHTCITPFLWIWAGLQMWPDSHSPDQVPSFSKGVNHSLDYVTLYHYIGQLKRFASSLKVENCHEVERDTWLEQGGASWSWKHLLIDSHQVEKASDSQPHNHKEQDSINNWWPWRRPQASEQTKVLAFILVSQHLAFILVRPWTENWANQCLDSWSMEIVR